jgi:hypothetical protein
MLQAGRSRVQVPMSWIFLNCPNPSGRAGPGVDSVSNRNEYQVSLKKNKETLGVKCGQRIGLTTLPPSISRLSK